MCVTVCATYGFVTTTRGTRIWLGGNFGHWNRFSFRLSCPIGKAWRENSWGFSIPRLISFTDRWSGRCGWFFGCISGSFSQISFNLTTKPCLKFELTFSEESIRIFSEFFIYLIFLFIYYLLPKKPTLRAKLTRLRSSQFATTQSRKWGPRESEPAHFPCPIRDPAHVHYNHVVCSPR